MTDWNVEVDGCEVSEVSTRFSMFYINKNIKSKECICEYILHMNMTLDLNHYIVAPTGFLPVLLLI